MRGYQKKVIYLKNTGSRNFEEAYFVLRSDIDSPKISEGEMIKEANTIIDENFGNSTRSFFYNKRWYFFTFFVGFALSFLICAIIGFF